MTRRTRPSAANALAWSCTAWRWACKTASAAATSPSSGEASLRIGGVHCRQILGDFAVERAQPLIQGSSA